MGSALESAPALPRITLRRPVSIEGPGLFSGRSVRLTLNPATVGTGIRFSGPPIPGRARPHVLAHVRHVERQPRHTVLRAEGIQIETVEHLLAALAGLGVTDAEIEIDLSAADPAEAPATNGDTAVVSVPIKRLEMPMGDGSALTFVIAIDEAGLEHTGAAVRPLVIREPVFVQADDGKSSLAALPGPSDALDVLYTFDGPAPVGRQVCSFRLEHGACADAPGGFRNALASARTFIFEAEAEALMQRGWGGHLNYTDLLVIGADGPLGGNAFRFPDEPVRHKVLDLIGDLSLVGRPVCGRIIAERSGHDLNHKLARALLDADEEIDTRALAVVPDPMMAGFRHLLARSASEAALDIRKIQRILPHRFPMLLIDRVLEIDGDRRAVGVKNITMGDVFFLGHYPAKPIFPGVLIVEAMGQLGGILLSRKLEHTGKIAVLLSMDGVKMRQPVTPGDQLVLVAEAVRVRSRTGHVRCEAYVADKLAAEADIKFMLVDADSDAE